MDPTPSFRPVHIHYHRPPDRTDIYRQELVLDGTEVKVTFQPATPLPRPVQVDGRTVLEPGSPAVWFTFPERWHDIGRFHDAAGRFTGIYANVLTPCQLHPAPRDPAEPIRWDTTDLFLDVWLDADGSVTVLDRDDLQEALEEGHVTGELAATARAEADRILSAFKEGAWPPLVVEAWPLERILALRGPDGDL